MSKASFKEAAEKLQNQLALEAAADRKALLEEREASLLKEIEEACKELNLSM